MSARQDKKQALEALSAMSMRRLRASEDFWKSDDAVKAMIEGRPALFWVIEQATKARVDRDSPARLGALNIVRWLLERGVDPNQRHKGQTPLMEAAILGDVAVARRLLKAGADIASVSGLGHTALHWAAMAGRPAMCRFLLCEGADLEWRNHDRQTPLHCAADRLRMNTVSVLHEAGANWAVRDVHDRTPLDVLHHRDPELAKLWINRPERDRLARATEPSENLAVAAPKRSRRL